jgi:pyruvate/2-oxoacid:ferredoxin oxidoreductase alpha subunit
MQLLELDPFPVERVTAILERAEQAILIESDITVRLGELINDKTGYAIESRILRYNGSPFFAGELTDSIAQRFKGCRCGLSMGSRLPR